MSSERGLWEDSHHRQIILGEGEPPQGLNEALLQNLVFVKTFSINGNLLAVFDAYQHQMALFHLGGEMLWSFGSQGEGPGHYAGSIEGTLTGHGLTIRDSSLGKLDLVDNSGALRLSLADPGAQTGIALADGRVCLISSWDNNGGIVSVYDSTGGLESSFGDDSGMWDPPSMPYYRFCVLHESTGLTAFASYKHTFICIADLNAGTVEFHSREYPFESPDFQEVGTPEGTGGIRVFPNINSMFIGPDGMINIQVLVPNRNGDFAAALVNYDRDYTVVDRFNWNGDYLDTYLVPMPRIGSLSYSEGFFYARSYDDDLIYRFPFQRYDGSSAAAI